MSDRHSNDGLPFYCEFCGAGFGEFMACESIDCKLEPDSAADARRLRWLAVKGKVRRAALGMWSQEDCEDELEVVPAADFDRALAFLKEVRDNPSGTHVMEWRGRVEAYLKEIRE